MIMIAVKLHKIIKKFHKIVSFRNISKITFKLKAMFLLKISEILRSYYGWWFANLSQQEKHFQIQQ